MVLLGQGHRLLIRGHRGKVHPGVLFHRLHHGQPLPVAQIDLAALVGDLQGAADILGHRLHHLLHQVHHPLVVGERLVELDGGELRVVLGVHPLVAEDAPHLVHPLHAAHDQPLEVQLGLDAQHHIHIQGVVVGIERAGGGADLKGGEDGGIHLQKALAVQIGPQLAQDLAALGEGILHLRVDNQVHIPLAVAQVGILEAVPLLRQREQGFGEQDDLLRLDRDLPLLGAEDLPLDPQDIPDIPLFKVGVGLLPHAVPAHIALHPAAAVLQVDEGGLAHNPAAHHPPGDGHPLALHLLKLGHNLGGGSGALVTGDGKGVPARRLQGVQLVPPDLEHLRELLGLLLGGLQLGVLLLVHPFHILTL